MANKLTLTDTHLVILSTASARPGQNLIPLPTCLGVRDPRLNTILDELVIHKLAKERAGAALDETWRTDDDQRIGLIITPAGLKAIGLDTDAQGDASEVEIAIEADDQTSAIKPTRAWSKQQRVIDMLSRTDGATLEEIVEATGWLKHTASASLTGLRKKGHAITRDKRGEKTCYYLLSNG